MDLALFDYHLPPELIAQEPAEPRDASRLLCLDRASGARLDRRFADVPDLLAPGDCVVVNTSRVIPARLEGETERDGRPVELLLVRALDAERWEALVRPGRRCRVGARISLAGGAARATVVGQEPGGSRIVAIEAPWPALELLERHGRPPLPPYIERHASPKPEDRERYQTVYAREPGSVAAPTAGLHFTPELIGRLAGRGVEVHELCLHVGPGTFRPIKTTTIEDHRMDGEAVTIPPETAEAVTRARQEGRRVVAVGTTTTRALEWAAEGEARGRSRGHGGVAPRAGVADLFIGPSHRFAVVDALLTNFHLPRTTLLVLVAAFAGRERILDAYRHAVASGYRFYSYGDAMLIT